MCCLAGLERLRERMGANVGHRSDDGKILAMLPRRIRSSGVSDSKVTDVESATMLRFLATAPEPVARTELERGQLPCSQCHRNRSHAHHGDRTGSRLGIVGTWGTVAVPRVAACFMAWRGISRSVTSRRFWDHEAGRFAQPVATMLVIHPVPGASQRSR